MSLHDILSDLSKQDQINEIIRSHDEFDIVPAHAQMFQTESELTSAIRREERLQLALAELNKEYEFILIDCPPNLGALTNNAFLAAEHILLPARPTSKSIKAIELLMHQKSALENGYSTNIDIVGVVGNEVSYDNESKEMMDWFEETFESIAPIFAVRSRVALQRAADNSGSIFAYSVDCDMEAEYLRIAESLVDEAWQEGRTDA
ncbi:ParA domain-containing protein [Haloferax prahovense DSM 18310]|uniref:ParA domain-containing protein n=2 Tax=Haloferax prahovense TaxID=381852 RepID=M0G464_HALPT|nr:ParA domain-containing protein [Haloferax prahovense DSM 18310]